VAVQGGGRSPRATTTDGIATDYGTRRTATRLVHSDVLVAHGDVDPSSRFDRRAVIVRYGVDINVRLVTNDAGIVELRWFRFANQSS
jgi:hypothetical protein